MDCYEAAIDLIAMSQWNEAANPEMQSNDRHGIAVYNIIACIAEIHGIVRYVKLACGNKSNGRHL